MKRRKKKGDSELSGKTQINVTEEGKANGFKVAHLRVLLQDLKAYKTYENDYAKACAKRQKAEKAFQKRRTERRLRKYSKAADECGRLKSQHERTDLEMYEKELIEYEKIIDRKYWNEKDLGYMSIGLILGFIKTIDEAVEMLEKRRK